VATLIASSRSSLSAIPASPKKSVSTLATWLSGFAAMAKPCPALASRATTSSPITAESMNVAAVRSITVDLGGPHMPRRSDPRSKDRAPAEGDEAHTGTVFDADKTGAAHH
jgi:hypothetical protein